MIDVDIYVEIDYSCLRLLNYVWFIIHTYVIFKQRMSLGSHWTVIGQSLGSHWAVIGQSLGSHWEVIG